MSDDINDQIRALAGAEIDVVYCDPPWRFRANSEANPGRNPMRHYPIMSLAEIAAIPVKAILAKNAAVFMWVPPAFIVVGAHIPIMKAWGVEPKSFGFTWVKTKRSVPWHAKISEADLHLNTGLTTRKQAEQCILGARGLSLRVDAGVREIVIAPLREHSRKPDQVAQRILRYVGPGRKCIEMFSRSDAPGFTALGNETGKFDE